jgi:hypothetical protein
VGGSPYRDKTQGFYFEEDVMNLDDLFLKVRGIANKEFDGHFTILKFTTKYKGMFGTIDVDALTGRDFIRNLPDFLTLQDALGYMINKKPHQPGNHIDKIMRAAEIAETVFRHDKRKGGRNANHA